MLRVRELLIIKDIPHIILDILDDETGEQFVCCNKADHKSNKA